MSIRQVLVFLQRRLGNPLVSQTPSAALESELKYIGYYPDLTFIILHTYYLRKYLFSLIVPEKKKIFWSTYPTSQICVKSKLQIYCKGQTCFTSIKTAMHKFLTKTKDFLTYLSFIQSSFFICYLTTSRWILSQCRENSLTHPILITTSFYFNPKVTGSFVTSLFLQTKSIYQKSYQYNFHINTMVKIREIGIVLI